MAFFVVCSIIYTPDVYRKGSPPVYHARGGTVKNINLSIIIRKTYPYVTDRYCIGLRSYGVAVYEPFPIDKTLC